MSRGRRPGLGLLYARRYARQSPSIPFAGMGSRGEQADDKPILPPGLPVELHSVGCNCGQHPWRHFVTARSLTVETIVKAVRNGIIPQHLVDRLGGTAGDQANMALLEHMADRINLELYGHVGR